MNKEYLDQMLPEDHHMANLLDATAQSIQVDPAFQNDLEVKMKSTFTAKSKRDRFKVKLLPALGWTLAAIGFIFLLNWAIRSFTSVPEPAANTTPIPQVVPPTEAVSTGESTPVPVSDSDIYERNGNPLYLATPLPDVPSEANLYQLNAEQPATIDSVRALASRFGVEGEVYIAPSEVPGTSNFMVTDGRQRLYVRSDLYFTYYKDYETYSSTMFSYSEPIQQDKALASIDEFLKSHGFDFPHQVENAPQIVNDFYVIPLSSDGYPLRYDYLTAPRLELKLENTGQIIFAQANLLDYQQIGIYGIITAEEAFQKMLAQNGQVGMQEAQRSAGLLKEQVWQRNYPENETLTLYGRVKSFPSAEAGQMPYISLGDYSVTGNIAGMENVGTETVEASGQLHSENEIRSFVVDSWRTTDAMEASVLGTLRQEGGQVILTALDGSGGYLLDGSSEYLIEDSPMDLPLDSQSPDEQLSVNGVIANGKLIWSSIQYFPSSSGGGGGGGGTGLYKLNLTGEPVPFPTPAPTQETEPETGNYVVQAGDTLSQISNDYGITVNELMQANGLKDSNIFIGQTLIIPRAMQELSQTIDGLRGLVSITIYNSPNGSQRVDYNFFSNAGPYMSLPLEGENLQPLQNYQNRPIDVWGMLELQNGTPILKVDRYEIPYPDLQFQILHGTQQSVTLEGQPAMLFTTTDGQQYVQFSPNGNVDGSTVGNPGDEIQLEALAIPDEAFGGYPAIRVFSASMAINPKSGQPQEMQVSADQVQIIDEQQNPEEFTVPVPTIEKVELAYYTKDQRYAVTDPSTEPAYMQPVWRFYGHYNNGDEFEILVQALKQEFLLPETELIQPPG